MLNQHIQGGPIKNWHFIFVHIFTSYSQISKILSLAVWHILRTICNNANIIYATTP